MCARLMSAVMDDFVDKYRSVFWMITCGHEENIFGNKNYKKRGKNE
jgi:hypothetical protein